MKIKISHIRIIASSSIGAVYSIMLYMQILPIYSSIFMKIILSVVMVYISYAPKSVKIAIKQLIIFYLISFAFGGCAFALLYFVKPQDIFIKNGVYIGTYPLKIALLGGIVGFVITYIAFKIIKNKATKEEMIYKLKIKINDKTVEVNALLDTGNKLKDPYSNKSIILIFCKKEFDKYFEFFEKLKFHNNEEQLSIINYLCFAYVLQSQFGSLAGNLFCIAYQYDVGHAVGQNLVGGLHCAGLGAFGQNNALLVGNRFVL